MAAPFSKPLLLVCGALIGLAPARAADDAAPFGPGLPLARTASRGIVTRDPSTIVKCKGEFWVFYTGRGVPSFHSKDLVKWEPGPRVFTEAPVWTARAVPNNRNMIYWAPDVMKVGDRYCLYYSISSLGSMTSAIGLVTNPTLDPKDPAYHWTDEGIVVQSAKGGDFNAIDPSVFRDDDGKLWLAFGSYWSGIKLIQLNPRTGLRISPHSPMASLAYNNSIEASFLTRHNGFYYLFVNWGSCCQGAASTYNIRVGRSKRVAGPYVDRNGVELLKSGGSLVLDRTGPLFGPGHAALVEKDGRTWFSCHFEADQRLGGRPTLGIMPFRWTADGWPEVELPDK